MAQRYPFETQNLTETHGPDYHTIDRSTVVDWSDRRLARITRLRLLTDPGFPMWDVSYCHGVLRDGTPVTVSLPFSQLPKADLRRAIVRYAREDNVYAKGLGVFDALSLLW